MKILKIIFFLFCSLNVQTIIAQDFEISPAALEFKIDPFETQNKVINITNHSNKTTLFKLSYADFIFDSDGKMETVPAKTTTNSCMAWLLPEQDVFEIEPNQSFELKVSMQVPEEDYTSRWGYLYIQTSKEQDAFNADKETARTGLNLQGRIAIEVIREAKTKQLSKMYIRNLIELEDIQKSAKELNNRVFEVNIENKGLSIHECKVQFIASDLSTAKEYEFEKITIKSFPGFTRKVKFVLPKSLAEGQYSLVALLDYGNKATIEGTRLKNNLIILK